MKTISIVTPYAEILENVNFNTIQSAHVGASNLLADYINDFSNSGINTFVADFICDHVKALDRLDVENILDNNDFIIQSAAHVFYDAMTQGVTNGSLSDVETIIRGAKTYFGTYVGSTYFVYGVQWSNACCRYYIIRAANESDAMDIVTNEFESDFIVDQSDVLDDDNQSYNDNGTPINIDNLVMVASIEFKSKY